MEKEYYSVKEFAKKLGISTKTVYRAIENGRINAFRAGPSATSPFRIAATEINRMGIVDLEKFIEKKIHERL